MGGISSLRPASEAWNFGGVAMGFFSSFISGLHSSWLFSNLIVEDSESPGWTAPRPVRTKSDYEFVKTI
jgi:hypothetical protein